MDEDELKDIMPDDDEQLSPEPVDMTQANRADTEAFALVNAVLSDAYSSSSAYETEKFVRNPENFPTFAEQINAFRRRNVQMFELQDDVIRTRSQVTEMHRTTDDLKRQMWLMLVIAVVIMILILGIFGLVIIKNVQLQQQLNLINAALVRSPEPIETEITGEITVTEVERSGTPAVRSTSTAQVPTETPVMIDEVAATEVTAESLPEDPLRSMLGRGVTIDLPGNASLFDSAEMRPGSDVYGVVMNYSTGVSARLTDFTEDAVCLNFTFNIGRSQISEENDVTVKATTYVRQFSEIPGETRPVFIAQRDLNLLEPARDCTDGNQSFCHGTITIWLDRDSVEDSIH